MATPVTFLNGVVGGLVATIVMTVFMMALGDDSPPAALFWSKYVQEGDPSDYMPQGLSLHLIYGVTAAAVFALALPPAGAELISMQWALIYGFGYGVILFVIGSIFWRNFVLDIDSEPKQVGYFLLFHLIYGGVLGAFVGYGPL